MPVADKKISVLIVADNASATIERAIKSALPQVDEVVVLDNASTDLTAERIESLRESRVRLLKQDSRLSEGAAKVACLQACTTPYAAWLRHTDEFLPNRIATLLPWLEQGYDWVFDNIELYDIYGSGKLGRTVHPDFVKDKDGINYQFARNYIKGEGVPLVRVEEALKVGYRSLQNVANYDHFLRAIIHSGNIRIHHSVTYRKYIDKLAAALEKEQQKEESKIVLKQIGFEALRTHLERTSLTEAQKFEIKLFYLSNTDDWQGIRKLIASKPKCNTPYFNWLLYFMEGVADYMLGDIQQSLQHTTAAVAVQRRPESLNNLAVCAALLGDEYQSLLDEALSKSPGYLDALYNREQKATRITPVPLRGFDMPEFIASAV